MAPLPARDIQPEVDFTDYTIDRVAGAVNGQLGGECLDRAFRLVTLPFASECLIRRTPFGRDGGRARCVLSFSGKPLTLASSYFSSLRIKGMRSRLHPFSLSFVRKLMLLRSRQEHQLHGIPF